MEQNQLKQFTFYDLYAELMVVLNDEERGKLLRRMCEYMFMDGEQRFILCGVFTFRDLSFIIL